eukprot:gene2198-4276_t
MALLEGSNLVNAVFDVIRLGDNVLLEWISGAEKGLKIFIYKKPSIEVGPNNVTAPCLDDFLPESRIPAYIRNSTIYTTNPDEANLFLIKNDFSYLFVCGIANQPHLSLNIFREEHIYKRHLMVIMNNITHNYPYFNRSGNSDHLFIYTFDMGPFCQKLHESFGNVFSKLQNVTFLQNFGHIGPARDGSNCVRPPGTDIILPQYHSWTPHHLATHFVPSKTIDSFFVVSYSNISFCSTNIRVVLRAVGHNATYRLFNAEHRSNDGKSAITDSYFALCPAGYAPWSRRVYEALLKNSIPVILPNGIVEPFERYLDLTKFSVKFNTDYISISNLSFLERMHDAGGEHRIFISPISRPSLHHLCRPLLDLYQHFTCWFLQQYRKRKTQSYTFLPYPYFPPWSHSPISMSTSLPMVETSLSGHPCCCLP